jgi:hypothetical protein
VLMQWMSAQLGAARDGMLKFGFGARWPPGYSHWRATTEQYRVHSMLQQVVRRFP